MTTDDIKAILDPIQARWLPHIESADAPEWRAHYIRAAISEAFIAGRQSMLEPTDSLTCHPATDPLVLLPALNSARL